MNTSPIIGEGTTVVDAGPAAVVEFVLDLERYREADHKIGRVGAIERNGDTGTVSFAGRLAGLPGPMGTYPFEVTGHDLRIGSPIAGPARWFLDFEGTFRCEPATQGTIVHHREVFSFKRPWRWIAAPLLRSWLANDVQAEMVRLGALLDRQPRKANT